MIESTHAEPPTSPGGDPGSDDTIDAHRSCNQRCRSHPFSPGRTRRLLAFSAGAELLPQRIVVVDDDPEGDDAPKVIAECDRSSLIRYVPGDSRGLAAAHNRGLLEVETPLIAFTDDDVVAEEDWLAGLVDAFSASPEVGCVTGMIRALELETDEQVWLDGYAGFSKGATRRVFDLTENRPADPLFPFAAGSLGSGANMAFSRRALDEIGGFDPALGAGTVARGGDDLSAFFEVILQGYRLVYEPQAVVRHRHAHTLEALRGQVYGYGLGLTAYLTKCLLDRPRLLPSVVRQLPRAVAHALAPGSQRNARRPADYPRELVWRERRGMLAGPVAYLRSRRQARRHGAAQGRPR